MKNVLLTTTALVVLAGAAAADVGFSGDAKVKYNDMTGFGYSANLDLEYTAALNHGITATLTWGIKIFGDDFNAADNDNWTKVADAFPTLVLTDGTYTFTFGGVDLASDHYSDVSGMAVGAGDRDGAAILRLDGAVAGYFDASVSYVAEDYTEGGDSTVDEEDIAVGVSGTFGQFSFGLGYETDNTSAAAGNAFIGANVGATFGGITVDLAYATAGANSIGVSLGYEISSAISVGAYYAQNSAADDKFGVSLDYTSGPLTVGVAYKDGTGAVTGNATIDVTYDLGGGIMTYAGYNQADGGYVGVEYDLGSDAMVWASFSEFGDAGDPEFDEGITIGVSASF
ncbi:MAG: porin [Paracoccaceae bacterium]